MVINSIIESRVSIARINKYLLSQDRDESSVQWNVNNGKDDVAVEIKNGNFSWGEKENPVLNDINLKVKRGELIALVGSVGSGSNDFIRYFIILILPLFFGLFLFFLIFFIFFNF